MRGRRFAAVGPSIRFGRVVVALVLLAAASAAALVMLSGPSSAVASGECPSGEGAKSVTAWGQTSRLGLGYTASAEGSPRTVLNLTNVRHLTDGFEFELAITGSNCEITSWGNNWTNALGIGNHQRTSELQKVVTESGAPLAQVKEIAAEGAHPMALRFDGTVWTWGAGDIGERGNGESGFERHALETEEGAKPRSFAIEVSALNGHGSPVKQIATGGKRDYALLANGELYGWGDNHDQILGVAETSEKCFGELHSIAPISCITKPTLIATGVEYVSASEEATYIVVNEGREVKAWGGNPRGQLGDGNAEEPATHGTRKTVSLSLPEGTRIVEVSANGQFALARTNTERVYSWGANGGGQLGVQNSGESPCHSAACIPTPQLIPSFTHVVKVTAGVSSSFGLKEELSGEKKLYAWGDNGKLLLLGLGLGQKESKWVPTRIEGQPPVADMAISSTAATEALEGEGPLPAVELEKKESALKVIWHVEGEGFKLRWHPVANKNETSKNEERPGCTGKPECQTQTFTFEHLPIEPISVEFTTTTRNAESKLVNHIRHIVGTPTPPAGTPLNTAMPYITTAEPLPELFQEGHTLVAHPGEWSPEATEGFKYQWLRCKGLGVEGSEEELGAGCEEIETAKGAEYIPTEADRGHSLAVEVTASREHKQLSAITPEPAFLVIGAEETTFPEPPVNTVRPEVAGAPLIGHELTAKAGSWSPTEPNSAKPVLAEQMLLCSAQREEEPKEGEEAEELGARCGPVGENGKFTPDQPSGEKETLAEKAKNSPVGKFVEVKETAVNGGGTAQVFSAAVEIRAAGEPVAIKPPKIKPGTTVEAGQTLKLEEQVDEEEEETGKELNGHNSWTNVAHWTEAAEKPPAEQQYQWYRCPVPGPAEHEGCIAISGATKSTYKIQNIDEKHSLEIEEKVVNKFGVEETVGHGHATSAATIEVPKVETVKPKVAPGSLKFISRAAKQGVALEFERGTWTGATTKSFTWQSCEGVGNCKAIKHVGEVATYTPTSEVVGKTIRVHENAVNSAGGEVANTEETETVVAIPPVNVKPPILEGTAQSTEALTVKAGTWTNEPTGYKYQWLRCNSTGFECVSILGATASSYRLGVEDIGHEIRVEEKAENSGGAGAGVNSGASEPVETEPPTNLEAPSITGSAPPQKGAALKAEHGTWTPEPSLPYTYKWFRCNASGGECAAISGATLENYEPVEADVGHALKVEVRASTGPHAWTPATSSATSAVAEPVPSITSVSPSTGPLGCNETVTISGSHLGDAALTGETGHVHFGSVEASKASIHKVSESTITVEQPSTGTGIVDVTVTTKYGTTTVVPADEFTYTASPCVTGVSPASGSALGGREVVITGTHLAGLTSVQFGAVAATAFENISETDAKAIAPAGTGKVHVVVKSESGTSPTVPADEFTYIPVPVVASVSPSEGPGSGGNTVTITGEHLESVSAVKFGSAGATGLEQVSPTQVRAKAPAGTAGETVDVTVTTGGGTSTTSSADHYTYTPPPAITGISPKQGVAKGGTVVTITGTNLTGASAVKFGGKSATVFKVNSPTSMEATSPAEGSGGAPITVTTPGGTSALVPADEFTYIPVPVVAQVSPTKVGLAGGETVTVEGSSFNEATSVALIRGGETLAAVTSLTLTGTSKLKFTSPALSTAGVVDVRVITPYGESALVTKDHLPYGATIEKVEPESGPAAGGTEVTITGKGFTTTPEKAEFGNELATGLSCSSSTKCTVKSPKHAVGKIDVQLFINGASSVKSSGDKYTYN